MDELTRPVVTVSNPSRPAPAGDVLQAGDERRRRFEGWRPSRRLKGTVAYVVAVALCATLPAYVVRERADGARADLAAADGVTLLPQPADSEGPLALAIENGSDLGLTLIDATLDTPGARTVRIGRHLNARGTTTVTLMDTRTCSPDLLLEQSTGTVLLRARTDAGHLVTRRPPLPESVWQELVRQAQDRCRILPAARILDVTFAPVSRQASVDLMATFRNGGDVAVRVQYFDLLSAGFTLDADEPTVPAGGSVTRPFRVTVNDCAQAADDLAVGNELITAQVSYTAPGLPEQVGGVVLADETLQSFAGALAALVARQCGDDS
jgi:hypothetical protein